jgi:hypothetical protein
MGGEMRGDRMEEALFFILAKGCIARGLGAETVRYG